MRAPRSPGWADVVGSVLLVLAVSVPTMLLEEDWHGRPMIDQPTHLWILAACLVAAAFFAGGAVVAFRRPSAATRSAVATGVLAVGILLIGALYRRLWVAHEFTPRGVQLLWLAGAIAAITMTLAGSLLGRQLARERNTAQKSS
jgi:drug/metabolite transporter (DMT)-like permease